MAWLSNFRERFWPILEPLKETELTPIENIDVLDKDLDTAYELALKYYDSEDERKKAVESKSMIFISAIGIVITIILSLASGLMLNPNIPATGLSLISITALVVIALYLCTTLWHSIKALERQRYRSFDYKDINSRSVLYKKELVQLILEMARSNGLVIDRKVDQMVMAQEFFKRAIVTAVIYSILASSFWILSQIIAWWSYP